MELHPLDKNAKKIASFSAKVKEKYAAKRVWVNVSKKTSKSKNLDKEIGHLVIDRKVRSLVGCEEVEQL